MSGVEPGGKLTITRTGFDGYACETATAGNAKMAATRT
jgi:hypothetical protein